MSDVRTTHNEIWFGNDFLARLTMAGKQAKTLSSTQINTALLAIAGHRHATRDRALFLLSVKAGLRAGEIALLEWSMITDADGMVGDAIHLQDRIAKKGSGRAIPLNRELRAALVNLHGESDPAPHHRVIHSERGAGLSPNSVVQWFGRLYRELGFFGCTSHSGRRTFVTVAARKVALVGGSLRDVQQLAGHRSLSHTALYVDGDTEAKRKVVDLI